eukprot:scaffold1669_cov129-Cylindrotheca_fusiformis.AAC.14
MSVPQNPACFRSSFRVFEDGAERNPDLPSFFLAGEPSLEAEPGVDFSIGHFRNHFDLTSSKGLPISEGPTLSLQQIIQFQGMIRGHLERKRHGRSLGRIAHLQALARGFLKKTQFSTMKRSAVVCQSCIRGYLIRNEAAKLGHIQNPPHIRKLRNQIAAIQVKLDYLSEEREKINLERERRKAEIREEVRQKIAAEERNKRLSISQVKSTGSQLISYLRTENIALRDSMKTLAQDIADIRANNEWLEQDTQVFTQYTHVLHGHYNKMKKTNCALRKKVTKLRTQVKPKWRNALIERKNYACNEARQKYLYRQGLFRIVDHLCLDQSCDSKTKASLFQTIRNCEDEFDFELDLDTPPHLFPTVPDSESDHICLEYESDDEDIPEVDFEWIDESKLYLPDLSALTDSKNKALALYGDEENSIASDSDSSDSQLVGSSDDSSSDSDCSSSETSSEVESVRSVSSHSVEKTQSIEEYIQLNSIVPPSPINHGNANSCETLSKDSSTACSTESDYEVASTASTVDGQLNFEEKEEDGKDLIQTEKKPVARDNNEDTSMPCDEMADWGREAEDDRESLKYPCVITVTSQTDLDWKVKGQADSYTQASTTCTTALESDFASTFSEEELDQFDDTNQIRGLAMTQGETQAETADDHSEHESVLGVESQIGDKRCTDAVTQSHTCSDEEYQEKSSPPKSTDVSKTPNWAQSVVERAPVVQAPLDEMSNVNSHPTPPQKDNAQPASRAPGPTIPVKPRRPATGVPKPESSVGNLKTFQARPAPKFNAPKIPVRQRDPSRLRSRFTARPAPKRGKPAIPVRHRNPSKLCSST